jgi:hypothetical protein
LKTTYRYARQLVGTQRATRRRAVSLVAGLAAVALLVATSAGATQTQAAAAKSNKYSLQGVCPSTVTVQTNWSPSIGNDYELYELAAPNGVIDADNKDYTAELIAHGHDTGVKIQLLEGGQAIAFQYGGALLREHSNILIADSSTDEDIGQAATNPLVEIVAPYQESAEGVMWDPQAHPTWKTIADVGKSGEPVYVSNAVQLGFDFLVDKGVLQASQIEKTYTGSPAQFIAGGGEAAQQDYVDNEPFSYEHVYTQWLKPVVSQLISAYGYNPYEAVSTLPQYVTTYAKCFAKLVPDIQQAAVDYVANPKATDALVVKLAAAYGVVGYTAAQAAWTAKALTADGLVANGPDGVIGSFNLPRVNSLINISAPLEAAEHEAVDSSLTASQLVTNRFIDKKIHLPSTKK